MNRENLQTLATFLAYDPRGVDFDMADFSKSAARDTETVCGAAGCAVGHATFIWPKKRGEEYGVYGMKLFGYESRPWSWCFGGGWAWEDNTRLGAARRIQYFLDNGVPVGYNIARREFVALYRDVEVKTDNPRNSRTTRHGT